ncbi:MAG: hypothetical protein ACYDA5_01925 [Vulcanimicrobiaceae bacterium]
MARKTTALALLLTTALACAAPALGATCTRDTLTVRGVALYVNYCIVAPPTALPGDETSVTVAETFTSGSRTYRRTSILQFIAGQASSRVIESVSLASVGLHGTLHTTLLYRNGQVRLDGALLTPGAIVIR